MDTTPKNKIEEVGNEEKIREEIKRKALEKVKQKAVVVNVDELAEAEARKAADAYMTESKESLKGIKNIVKKIWKHTFFDEYYRQRQINRTREEIKNSDNIYVGRIKDNNKVAHESAMRGISERFISEYDEALSEGEEKKILDNKNPEVIKSSTDIKNLIIDYAKGVIDDDAFKNEKTRILNGLNGQDDILGGTRNYADNLFEIAKNAKIAIDHEAKIEELDLDTNIIIGKAKSSLKTEAHFNWVDKGIDKMKKSKVGRFISPAVLSTAIGIAYSVTVGVSKKVMSSKAAAIATLGGAVVVSSAFAGANESQRVALERKQHGIEMAEGGKIDPGSKRREQMEKYSYQMEDSSNLAEKLRSLMFIKDKDGKDVIRDDIKEDEIVTIMAHISEIEARNSLNAKNRIDLISYSNIGNVEKERTDLTILTAKAKVELRKKVERDLKNGIPVGETFDSYLLKQTQTVENSLLDGEKGINAQDKAFRKYKASRIAKKMAQTAVAGLIIGGTIQETVAFLNDDVQGFVEGVFHHDIGATIQTPFGHIHDWISGHPSHVGMGNAVVANFNGHNFRLPEGMSLLQNPDGTCDIMKGDQLISNNISLDFDANGNLDTESITKLGEAGIIANTTHTVINGTQEVTSNGNDYLNHHPGSTHHISRDGWYDNNTPKPIFDQNELKLQWGEGVGGAGIDADGNYVLDVSHMTSDGSFHNEFSVDAQEKMKDGGLKIILSLTQGTQHQTFEVPIDVSGKAVVDPDSEIGKLFFGNEDGHAVFKGRFAEVVQSFGTHDGAEHVKSLATLVGPGNDSITDTVVTHIDNPITTIQPPIGTQPPMFIPVVARKPLEKLKEDDVIPFYYFGGSGFESNQLNKEHYENDRSETLKNNPDANLDQFKEIETYIKKQEPKYKEYLKKIASDMGPMNKECRLAVCIPVAGHQEGENIYNTLKNYSTQTAKNKDFEIVLFVNRPEKDASGKKIKPDKTLEEIERFKKDFPEMNIRISEKVLPIEDANIGHIRKVMNDAVLIRQINRGKDAPDFFMVSNDADNKGVSPEYIKNFISKFDNYKEVDAMVGQLDWDIESYIRNPLIHIGTRLFQYEGAQSRSKGWHFNSSGANFAFRSSIYAGVGGYSDNMRGGEDTDFGAKITTARAGAKEKKPIIYGGTRVSRIFTSSRRAEMVMKKHGLAPIEQWDKGFSAFDDEVRKVNWEDNGKKIDYNNKEEVEKLISSLETVINRTIKRSEAWGTTSTSSSIIRSLGWLGIKYKVVNNNSIKITDATNLIAGLKKYQEEGMEILKRKTTLQKTVVTRKSGPEKTLEAEEPKSTTPETKETKEMISSDRIKKIIRDQLINSGRIENINELDLNFVGDKLIVSGDINGKGLAGKIKIKGSLENSGDMIALGKDIDIEANFVTKPIIKSNLGKVAPKIKEHFEKEYGKKIKSIKIEKGQIALTFDD